MSKLESLIDELCPDGVEYKPLNDVIISLKTGLNPRKNFVLNTNDATNYYVTVREIVNGKIVFFDKTDKVNNSALTLINNRSNLETGDVLFSGTGTVGRTAVIEKTPTNWNIKEGVYTIKPNKDELNSKYLSYLLNTTQIKDTYKKRIVGSPVCSLPMTELKKIKLPVPPLEVQAEIVRMLDCFTELIDLLNIELGKRKQQYEYYRNKLLSFGNDVPYIELGECCFVQSGGTPARNKNEYWDNGTIKWLGSTVCKNKKTVESITEYITELGLQKSSAKIMPKNTTLIALVGATIGKVAFLSFEATTNQNIASLYPKYTDKLNPHYLYHACSLLYSKFLNLGNEKLTMANLSFVRNLKIPVPPLEEQERIANILDRFDSLCNDLLSGIPAEIKARQKQYEYYRDKLLTFKQADNDKSI